MDRIQANASDEKNDFTNQDLLSRVGGDDIAALRTAPKLSAAEPLVRDPDLKKEEAGQLGSSPFLNIFKTSTEKSKSDPKKIENLEGIYLNR